MCNNMQPKILKKITFFQDSAQLGSDLFGSVKVVNLPVLSAAGSFPCQSNK